MRRNPARTEALRLHQAAVDRLIFLAVKRREAERELREYASGAYAANEGANGTELARG